jgi:DNA-binding PadR family transcriptional regulator
MTKPAMRTLRGSAVTPAEFFILLALVDRERHGYAIMQRVASESEDAVRLGPGTLYGAIKRLLDNGYIHEVESRIDPELDDARRKYYGLTTSGRAAVRAEAERLDRLVGLARAKRVLDTPAGAGSGTR